MKTVIIYYSYSGNTRGIAQELAAKESAEIVEIKDVKRPGKLKAYSAGIIASIKGKAWPILPLGVDLAGFDKFILLAPVWANNPPPAFNAILELLPEGKDVSFKLVSASGKSNCTERLEAAVKAKGCNFSSFEDVKV